MHFSHTKGTNKQLNTFSLVAFVAVILFSLGMFFTSDMLLTAVYIVLSSAASAYLFTFNGKLLPILSTFSAWSISLIFTRSAFSSLAVLIPLVYALTFSFVQKRRLTRSEAVGISSAVITLVSLVCLLSITYINTGKLSLFSIVDAFPSFFGEVKEVLYNSFTVKIANTEVQLITPGDVQKYLNLIIAVIPGALSAIFSMLGFFIGWVYSLVLRAVSFLRPDRSAWRIIPSPISSAFFVVAALISALAGGTNVLTLATANIALAFFPMFFVAGFNSAFEPIVKDGFARPRLLRPFILIIAFLNDIASFAIVSVIFAVYDSIKTAFYNPNKEKE